MTTTETTAQLHAYFGYRDAGAAIDWLGEAFGFEPTMQFPDEQGGVAHAELRLDDAVVIVFTDRAGYQRPPSQGPTTGLGMYLALSSTDAVDAMYRRASAAGATPVWEPEHTEWGNYRCRVLDPEGFEWTFGIHRPGEPVEWE